MGDDEMLIEAVRQYQCLWKVRSKGYKDLRGKENAWNTFLLVIVRRFQRRKTSQTARRRRLVLLESLLLGMTRLKQGVPCIIINRNPLLDPPFIIGQRSRRW